MSSFADHLGEILGWILIVRHHGKFALAPKLQFEVLEDEGFSAVSRGTMLPFRVSRVTGAAYREIATWYQTAP